MVETRKRNTAWLAVIAFLLGAQVPVWQLRFELHAYYVFENWSELDEFDVEDLEYGAWLTYRF